jgi:hypothetical protein
MIGRKNLELMLRDRMLIVEEGVVSSADEWSITDETKNWQFDVWKGATVEVVSVREGKLVRQTFEIGYNTNNRISAVTRWLWLPQPGDIYFVKVFATRYLDIIYRYTPNLEIIKDLLWPSASPRSALIPAVLYRDWKWNYGYSSYNGILEGMMNESVSGGCVLLTSPGHYVEFQFVGRFFDVVFYNKAGSVRILVDGVEVATVDVSALKGPQFNLVWKGPSYLSDDYHTVRIEWVSGQPRIVGILVDPNRNAWNIAPFPEFQSDRDLLNEIGNLVPHASTTTPLLANKSWTSPVDNWFSTGRLVGTVFADQPGTLYVEQSPDGTNWDVVKYFSVSANAGLGFSVEKVAPYARVRYVNGPADQTVFRLFVYLRLRVI